MRGKVRLVYRTPNWQDFVLLAVSEIRQYGAGSVQIMRRLRGMLENLISVLTSPAGAAPAAAARTAEPVDRQNVLRSVGPGVRQDRGSQGLGGPVQHLEEDGEVVSDHFHSNEPAHRYRGRS